MLNVGLQKTTTREHPRKKGVTESNDYFGLLHNIIILQLLNYLYAQNKTPITKDSQKVYAFEKVIEKRRILSPLSLLANLLRFKRIC